MGLYVSFPRSLLFRWVGVPMGAIGGACWVECVQNGGD
mgnify:FL=1